MKIPIRTWNSIKKYFRNEHGSLWYGATAYGMKLSKDRFFNQSQLRFFRGLANNAPDYIGVSCIKYVPEQGLYQTVETKVLENL